MDREIKIAIVDDHHLFREGMDALLSNEPQIKIVKTYQNAKECLKELSKVDIDLILMDIDMPELNGIEAANQAFQLNKNLKIIMLSMHRNLSTIKEAMKVGVNGYLLKTSNHKELIGAIEMVMQGEDYFVKEIGKVLFGSFKTADNTGEIFLTKREKEILPLVCQGLLTEEIGEKLFISPHTVESHRRNLLNKTGCRNSAALVRFAMENKLV